MSSPSHRYKAFISYSSANRLEADRLQSALEAYRVPADIEPGQNHPRRVTPIFRDRSDASANPNLGDAIETALNESGFLIVLCSPEAAASTWVNREIEYYKSIGGSDRIIAVIADGDPAQFDPLKTPRGAFPPALMAQNSQSDLEKEPLAADLRPPEFGGDGERLAVLKVVAALLRVGLVALTQRDKAQIRKTRRLINITLPLVVFVSIIIAELLVFVPSFQNFASSYLSERVRVASVLLEAIERAPSEIISSELIEGLFLPADIISLAINHGDTRELVLPLDQSSKISITATIDVRAQDPASALFAVLPAIASKNEIHILIIDDHELYRGTSIEILISGATFRDQIYQFTWNVLSLSCIIAAVVALAQFLALRLAYRSDL